MVQAPPKPKHPMGQGAPWQMLQLRPCAHPVCAPLRHWADMLQGLPAQNRQWLPSELHT